MIGGRNNNLHSPAVERLMQMQRNQIFLLLLIPPIARQVKISGDKFHPRIQFFFATNVREGVGGQNTGKVSLLFLIRYKQILS